MKANVTKTWQRSAATTLTAVIVTSPRSFDEALVAGGQNKGSTMTQSANCKKLHKPPKIEEQRAMRTDCNFVIEGLTFRALEIDHY